MTMECFITCWANQNKIWISQGPIRLIHEEVHPCLSFFIQKSFKGVNVCWKLLLQCFLLQAIPSIDDTFWEEKCFLKSVLHLFFLIFAVWPLVRLFESSWKTVSNGTAEIPLNILKTSARFRRSSRVHKLSYILNVGVHHKCTCCCYYRKIVFAYIFFFTL